MADGWRLLLFGATGAIGGKVLDHALARGWEVVAASRNPTGQTDGERLRFVRYDPVEDDPAVVLADEPAFDAVCWAHGANLADSVVKFDAATHLDLYRANCLSVMVSLSALHESGLLKPSGARLTIVSSIWQEHARPNKLSYMVTKAAVGGIVRSAAVDLGPAGHLVNGVLPGVLQTPMTEANLTPQQLDAVRGLTAAGRLPDVATVADAILFLCSRENRSITGQSLTVDLGMTNASML